MAKKYNQHTKMKHAKFILTCLLIIALTLCTLLLMGKVEAIIIAISSGIQALQSK
jgi:hypothetical protein